jgi:hypothetical protein
MLQYLGNEPAQMRELIQDASTMKRLWPPGFVISNGRITQPHRIPSIGITFQRGDPLFRNNQYGIGGYKFLQWWQALVNGDEVAVPRVMDFAINHRNRRTAAEIQLALALTGFP